MIDLIATGLKIFLLDTNVVLHDSSCLMNFEEHDVALPITLFEELDRFKKGNEEINFHAREFLRQLDLLTGDAYSGETVSLGDDRGTVRVVIPSTFDARIRTAFFQETPDHRILNAAIALQNQEPEHKVILITKDTNLRMKAKALGVTAQDYTTDKVDNLERLYTGRRVIEGVESEVIQQFYQESSAVPRSLLDGHIADPISNENFVLRNGSKSVLATYRSGSTYERVIKGDAYGIAPRNAEQSFALKALLNDDIKLVTLAGKAGSGKTLLALAAALECRQRYRQILLARPIVPLSNRDLGFLPGDINAKLDPYMQPLYDNLNVIRHQFRETDPEASRIGAMLESEKLLITPLAYIRGRSLQRIFMIVDEAQNLTPHEVKTIVTRAGEGTKIVLTGDIHQIDHPYLDSLSNGLSYVISRMQGQSLYAHMTLEKGERSDLADLASDLL